MKVKNIIESLDKIQEKYKINMTLKLQAELMQAVFGEGTIDDWIRVIISNYEYKENRVGEIEIEENKKTFDFVTEKDIKYAVKVTKEKGMEIIEKPESGKLSGLVYNLSPVCTGIGFQEHLVSEKYFNKSLFVRALAGLNAETSQRVFNEVHYYPNDPNLTLGFGHSIGVNKKELCKRLVETSFLDFATQQIMENEDYKEQIKNDPSLKINSWKGTDEKDLRKRLKQFLITEVNNEWANKLIKSDYHKDKFRIYKKKKKNSEDFNMYRVTENSGKIVRTAIGKKYDGEKVIAYEGANVFREGFWFYDIMKQGLTLKDVCIVQVKLWREKVYNPAKEAADSLGLGEHIGGIGALVSWKSSRNIPYNQKTKKFKYSEENGYQYVITEENFYLKDPKGKTLTDSEIYKENISDTKALLIWMSYNYYKKKIRNRQRYIWNAFFAQHWELNSKIDYPKELSDIKYHKTIT